MEEVKKAISDYCMEEFVSKPDFSNLEAVPIGYTELYDENEDTHQLEIKVDLIHPRICWVLDGNEILEKNYLTLSKLTEYINEMTFSDLCWKVRENFNLD